MQAEIVRRSDQASRSIGHPKSPLHPVRPTPYAASLMRIVMQIAPLAHVRRAIRHASRTTLRAIARRAGYREAVRAVNRARRCAGDARRADAAARARRSRTPLLRRSRALPTGAGRLSDQSATPCRANLRSGAGHCLEGTETLVCALSIDGGQKEDHRQDPAVCGPEILLACVISSTPHLDNCRFLPLTATEPDGTRWRHPVRSRRLPAADLPVRLSPWHRAP